MKLLTLSAAAIAMSLSSASAAGYGEDTGGANPELDAAVALLEAEDFAGATPILRQLSADEPSDPDVFNLLGYALRKTGALEESGVAYAAALALDPHHSRALEYQGELFLMLDDVAAAEANLLKLQERCGFPCDEKDALAAAIADWRSQSVQ